MKRVLKWTLIGLAAAGCLAAVQMARQTADLPALPQEVVTTQPGVAADAVLVTYFSSDARCATCIRIERLTWENLQDVWTKQRDEGSVEAYVVDAVRRHLGTAT